MIKLKKCSRDRVDEILRERTSSANPRSDDESTAGERGENPRKTVRRTVSLKVADVMSTRVATIAFDDAVMVAGELFSRVRFHHLPVVDDAGDLMGIVSDRDFFRSVSPFFDTVNEQPRDAELMKRKVGLIMTRNPVVVAADAPLAEAVGLMNDRGISCLPVVARGTKRLMGVIAWKDVARAFCPGAFSLGSA